MAWHTLDLSAELALQLETIPASARVRCVFAGGRSCMFDPGDRSWHDFHADPSDPGDAWAAVLAGLAPETVHELEERLLEFARQRAERFAAQRGGGR